MESEIKLNLGCGWRNFGPDWEHIDGGSYPHLKSRDIFNLPYEDESVSLVYSSHVIEYFDREEVAPLLKRWKNIFLWKWRQCLRQSASRRGISWKIYW